MDLIQVLLLICAAAGIAMMIFAVMRFGSENDSGAGDYFEAGNTIKAIDSSVDEAEKVIDDLNKFAESVMTDIDNKHKELLFVYNLIDEKHNDLKRMYSGTEIRSFGADMPVNSYEADEEKRGLTEHSSNKGKKRKDSDFGALSGGAGKKDRRSEEEIKQDGGDDAPIMSINPKYDEVISLHVKGLSVSEISKNLNMGQGEVKLILELSSRNRMRS
ncbi:MAG: hypothetical protein LBS21_13500 [Clostridiales bacterium]|jgi:hypothetical protein|nr:hypothetical protein [Clostridiales bacterium]